MEEKKKKSFPLYLQILLGMIAGILWGFYAPKFPEGTKFTVDYIKPFGTIFLRLLQMVAIPLILTSLISGIANLKDFAKVGRIGGKTILLFFCTAICATFLGVTLASFIKPGKVISEETRNQMISKYQDATAKSISAYAQVEESPLTPLVEMVPSNFFGAASDNTRMLQVVFFGLLFGIALTRISSEKAATVVGFLEAVNEALLKMVMMIMAAAPVGVFALMASVLVELAGNGSQMVQLLYSLLWYAISVLIGLTVILLILYPAIFTFFSNIKYGQFFKGMRPAFLLAFTSSSSNATLPVTMERVEHHLKVPAEITGFVLPFGTTVNMDGTALYQSIAAVFIAQAFGLELTFFQQITIVFTATLAAVGAAGIPGAGMITLIAVLKSTDIPVEGIALILAPDRILDMCRTVVNVAGDAMAAVVVAGSEKSGGNS
ncbi:MAG: dicarboxylate/amino acid:cation symporter [Sporocytophaga sp.]|uniref:dicarboxylate/amino acid:cation symporter n=1 Tax=Sporocytophaga sp. TaxID=2231183 RepID=UPI001B11B4E5|nr:dicarboxylate/amino acid:cation symporter [Sporocytophaga sp.]MBO9700028.1 dicarboxylate/amino acid:cation symporter [Sporocytophaga sp.]